MFTLRRLSSLPGGEEWAVPELRTGELGWRQPRQGAVRVQMALQALSDEIIRRGLRTELKASELVMVCEETEQRPCPCSRQCMAATVRTLSVPKAHTLKALS